MRAGRKLMLAAASVLVLGNAPAAATPVVWSGLSTTFTKANGANPLLSANQDHLTANVALTRGSSQGLFNAVSESAYDKTTFAPPTGTTWATNLNNPSTTIAATNFAALTFGTWRVAYANRVGGNILNRDAVVHLVADDIYLDLRFTAWSGGGSGGGFTYMRSVAPPSGDYNGNGVVDAADYVLWRKTNNQSVSPAGSGADGNSSGAVDAGDYTYWRQRFGNITSGAGNGSATGSNVPEPSTGILLIWWLMALARRLR